ncbi:class D sortase [Cytobacillus sp. FJAT-54145]|uniref:Class D sortase n=1 Tax=Cytobacillus spartinae TaxID=3299023 RepID=A0ABW6KD75_9BACI
MLKYAAFIILISGLLLIGYGGLQFAQTKQQQEESIKIAKDIVSENQPLQQSNTETIKKEFNPKQGEVVGVLEIPKIGAELPIIEGTDEDELEKGVGHYKGTAYPLQNDQILLSGHRDTVFRRMGELEIGDIFTVKLPYGHFSYIIHEMKIVEADDRTVIRSTAPNDVLTVTTCYPFSYLGDAPQRYVINALPIKENKD